MSADLPTDRRPATTTPREPSRRRWPTSTRVPGAAEARPDRRRRRRHPALRRDDGRRRRPHRDPARRHHRADRAERRRQDHVLQPAHRLRQAQHRDLVVRREVVHGVSAARVARSGMVRTFQLTKALSRMTVIENMRLGATRAARREPGHRAVPAAVAGARGGDHGRRPTSCSPGSSSTPSATTSPAALSGGQRKLLEMARALMSEPTHGHARRADGRREPGAHAVAARATSRPCATRA